jgi:hypothetical protein
MQMTGRWRLRGAPLDRVFLPAILGVCVGLRIAWILRYEIDPRTLQADAIWYVFHAALLAAGAGFVDQFGNPTAAYPPGYPAMIAAAYAVFGEHDRIHQLLNVTLSALSCLFVFLFARRAHGRTTAWLAATLLALCPGDVFQAGVGLSGLAFQSLFMASLLVFLVLNGARREPSGFGWAGYGAVLRHEHGAHEGAGGEALAVEDLGQHRRSRVDAAGEVLGAVLGRVEPGHHRGVGGQGPGGLADGPLEERSFLCQRADPWSGVRLVPVARQVIGSEGVDGDEEDAGGLLPGTRQEEQRGQRGNRAPPHPIPPPWPWVPHPREAPGPLEASSRATS